MTAERSHKGRNGMIAYHLTSRNRDKKGNRRSCHALEGKQATEIASGSLDFFGLERLRDYGVET